MKRIVKSKYGFSSMAIGDKITVKAIELASMKSSLWKYNKTADSPITMQYNEISSSKVEALRIS